MPALCLEPPAPVDDAHLTRAGSCAVANTSIGVTFHPHLQCFLHQQAQLEESLSPAPAVSQSPARVVEHFSPAPAVFHAPTDLPARARAEVHVGGLQSSVPGQSSSSHRGEEQAEVPRVTLWLRKRTEGMVWIPVKARRSKPLRSVFQAYCRRLGLQESQVRFFCGELLSRDDTPDQLGLEDDHVTEAEEVYDEDDEEEEDDDDYDEFDGTESRFPAGFLPLWMCRWFPSGNCRQGWGACSLTV